MKPIEDITPDEDLVNKWRLAQGDLLVAVNGRGKISHAIPARLTIMKELIRKEQFPYHYEIYGMGFLELQNAFRSPMAAKCSSVMLEQFGIGASSGNASGLYLNACRLLGNKRVGQLEFLLGTMERRKKTLEVFKGIERRTEENMNEFSKCFERLIEIMDAEKERLAELAKNN